MWTPSTWKSGSHSLRERVDIISGPGNDTYSPSFPCEGRIAVPSLSWSSVLRPVSQVSVWAGEGAESREQGVLGG